MSLVVTLWGDRGGTRAIGQKDLQGIVTVE